MEIKRYEVGARYSGAVVHGNTIYMAGQVARDPTLPIRQQTEQVLAEIDRLLDTVGSNKTQILSVTIYLANMSDYVEMNAAWDAWIPKKQLPARATVQAALFKSEYRVEIAAIAAV
jgi:enamine deaminase RidA (YjgF/YER057c/UK114 family)